MYGQLFMLFLETSDNGKGGFSVKEIKVELLGKKVIYTNSGNLSIDPFFLKVKFQYLSASHIWTIVFFLLVQNMVTPNWCGLVQQLMSPVHM